MVAAVFAVIVVALLIIAVSIGLAWFIAIPVAVFLLLFPIAYVIALFTRPKGGSGGTPAVPSTEDASYQPIQDPSQPGATPR